MTGTVMLVALVSAVVWIAYEVSLPLVRFARAMRALDREEAQ
jgi:hypothetical protein